MNEQQTRGPSADAYTNFLHQGAAYSGFVYDGGYSFHCALCGAVIAWKHLLTHASGAVHRGLDTWPWVVSIDTNGLLVLLPEGPPDAHA